MVSAADRVCAVPELLEMILLSLPVRTDDRPDYQFFPLQRVNRNFHDVVNRPGPISQRMLIARAPSLLERLDVSGIDYLSPSYERRFRYYVYLSLTDTGFMPGADIILLRRTRRGMPLSRDVVYLQETLITAPRPFWDPETIPSQFEFPGIDPSDARFYYPNASWRRTPLHPGFKGELNFIVRLTDDEKLPKSLTAREIRYHFYSGDPFATLTLGDFYDFMGLVRTFTIEQHLWYQRQAGKKRKNALKAYRQTVAENKKRSADEPKKFARCDICKWALCCQNGCPGPARDRTREFLYFDECIRCRLTGSYGLRALPIFWPMDHKFFLKSGAIDEQGVHMIKKQLGKRR